MMRSNEVEENKIEYGRGRISLELGTDWRKIGYIQLTENTKTEQVGFSVIFPLIHENSVSILNTL